MLTGLRQSTYKRISICRLHQSSYFEYRGGMSSGMEHAIRVIIAEGSAAIRDRLTAALSQITNLEVIATASHGKEAIDLTLALRPDLLLLDASMRGINGLAVLKFLRQEAAGVIVVVLSNHAEPIYRKRFLSYGATEVLSKTTPIDEIEQAIRAVTEPGIASIGKQESRPGVDVCHAN